MEVTMLDFRVLEFSNPEILAARWPILKAVAITFA